MLKKINLGEGASRYVQAELADGDAFGKYLHELIDFSSGKFTTYVPDGIDIDLFDFRKSFLLSEGIDNVRSRTEKCFKEEIKDFLAGTTNRYVIFETLSLVGDSGYLKKDVDYFVYDAHIYFFLTSNDLGTEKIQTAIKWARGYPFIGVFTCLADRNQKLQRASSVSKAMILDLTSNTSQIWIGAFDGEGYVVWCKI